MTAVAPAIAIIAPGRTEITSSRSAAATRTTVLAAQSALVTNIRNRITTQDLPLSSRDSGYDYPTPAEAVYSDQNSDLNSSSEAEQSAATDPTAPQPKKSTFSTLPPEPNSFVQDVQEELTARGYFTGKADGLLTNEFQAALRRFQTDQHLVSSGMINQASLFALGLN